MTTPIRATTTPSPPTLPVTSPSRALAKQTDFLKLIAAQLQYQNPLEPTKDTEFIAQLAQFESLQKMDEVAKSIASLVSLSQLSQLSVLLGKQITASVNGKAVSGIVSRITLNGAEPAVYVGDQRIVLGEITEVTSERS
jgi:flagellar basal-body rod modification protein FlgD